jgi:hypothetical protein
MSGTVKCRTHTPIGRKIEGALASLNDQYEFFLFLEYEFIVQLQRSGPRLAEQFTTDVFAANPHSSRIHVQLKDLPAFGEGNRSVSFGAYFTASYEVAASFFEEALDFLRETNSIALPLRSSFRGGPEEYYATALTRARLCPPDTDLVRTISWIRHRRNGIVHVNLGLHSAYRDLTEQWGTSLNRFWSRTRLQVDFHVPATGPLTERETLDLLKLLRILIQRFDTHLVGLVDSEGLTRVEARRLFGAERMRMNKDVAARRAAVLGSQILRRFGLVPHERDINAAVQVVGVR